MNRRDTLLALLAFAGPPSLHAQPVKAPRRIGWLMPGSPDSFKPLVDAFTAKLKELGYVEGRDFVIEFRFSEGRFEVLAPLARELMALKPDVIVTATSSAVMAFKQETTSVPIVFGAVNNVVEQGLVARGASPTKPASALSHSAGDRPKSP